MIGNWQEPSCIGNKVFLPSAGHTDGYHALTDLQPLGIRTQGLDSAHTFQPHHSGELGGETVSATQHVQIAGVDWSRFHADQRLTGRWRGHRPGFQPQHIGRLANLSGYERAHGLWHERTFDSQRPRTRGVLDKKYAGAGILVGD